MTVIGLYFSDFKDLIGNKRLYYFMGENYYDFYFISDGMIIKSTLLKTDVRNQERFFSDAIFYNSKKLTFRIPDSEENLLENIGSIRQPLQAPITIIDKLQPKEQKNEDIQRVGVQK